MKFDIDAIASQLPTVDKPEMKLTFKEKMKWTGIILVLFFLLGSITVWGVDASAVARFEFLEIVFGSKFGSVLTLGIGPIVTASIILQLLVGSKIINWDTKTPEGKKKFMGMQKILTILFCIFESFAYVLAGAVPAAGGAAATMALVIVQLALGGYLVMLMDEVCQKWGIGSGVSLFIAAGVSKTILIRILTPPLQEGTGGMIYAIINAFAQGQPMSAFVSVLPFIATATVFVIVIYAQSMKIEIPMAFSLPFGKFGSRRWPLKFIYTSNIPVILTAAVIANIQVVGKILSQKGITFMGVYEASTGQPTGGLAFYLTAPSSIGIMMMAVLGGILGISFAFLAQKMWQKHVLRMSVLGGAIGVAIGYLLIGSMNLPVVAASDVIRSVTYVTAMVVGSVIFAKFWVATSGMDSKSVSEQFQSSFLTIPGFRRDPRIIETILDRYIPALTVLGGAFVGFLASFADLTNAYGTGTGILLSVMIIYQFYEQIVQQHWDDLPPAIQKFMGGS